MCTPRSWGASEGLEAASEPRCAGSGDAQCGLCGGEQAVMTSRWGRSAASSGHRMAWGAAAAIAGLALVVILTPVWGPSVGLISNYAGEHLKTGVLLVLLLVGSAVALASTDSRAGRAASVAAVVASVSIGIPVWLAWPTGAVGLAALAVVAFVVRSNRVFVGLLLLAALLPLGLLDGAPPVPLGSSRYPVSVAEFAVAALFLVVVVQHITSLPRPLAYRREWGLGVWLLVFIAGAVVATGTGVSPDGDLAQAFVRVVCILPAMLFFVVTRVVDSERGVLRAALALLCGGVALGVLLMLARVAGTWESADAAAQRTEGSYTLGFWTVTVQANTGSIFFGLLCVLALGIAVSSRTRLPRVIAGTSLGVSLTGVVFLATRGVWLSLPPMLLLTLVLAAGRSTRAWRRAVLLGVVGLAVVSAIAQLAATSSDISRRFGTLGSLDVLLSDPNWQGRSGQFSPLLKMWLDHPFGTGYFSIVPGQEIAIHNLYLFLLLSAGPLGLVAWLGFAVGALVRCASALRSATGSLRGVLAGVVGGLAFVLATGFIGSGLLWREKYGLLFMLMTSVGVVAASIVSRRSAEGSSVVSESTRWPTGRDHSCGVASSPARSAAVSRPGATGGGASPAR